MKYKNSILSLKHELINILIFLVIMRNVILFRLFVRSRRCFKIGVSPKLNVLECSNILNDIDNTF